MAARPTDPSPKSDLVLPPVFDWQEVGRIRCPAIVAPNQMAFAEVIERRRSIRIMSRPSLKAVLNTVGFASAVRQIKEGDPLGRSRRPSAAAGAIHPVEVLLMWPAGKSRVFRYDPLARQLAMLRLDADEGLSAFRQRLRNMVPDADGAVLVLAAEESRLSATYSNSQSLLWRDAGALVQTLHLSATAFGLAFCPLGVLGNEVVAALSCGPGLQALGTAMLGDLSG